jgi:hypothetical protein
MQGPTAGLLFTLTLPASKITTRLPFFLTTNTVTLPRQGLGLVPDVMAPMTGEAFIMQQDPALEAAIRLANSGVANTMQ